PAKILDHRHGVSALDPELYQRIERLNLLRKIDLDEAAQLSCCQATLPENLERFIATGHLDADQDCARSLQRLNPTFEERRNGGIDTLIEEVAWNSDAQPQ